MSDLVLVRSFPHETEAQIVASALRDVGLHPVVLGHDPLAQLFTPLRAARLLVPAEELEEARAQLGAAREVQGEEGEQRARESEGRALAGFFWVVLFGFAAYRAPHLLPLVVLAAVGAWIWTRRARRQEPDA